ncbi:Bacterial PH domain-containing protein [Bifidobacterium lemurum]|uniref:Bacterial PH domain-containing protein n=2 Tax=Bifidobacterium lemurum TaxID=1603886 RepID=A0A261FS93_9BIFI|nr:PH domain-containing protein [Bifidobacterium lemurum]OZG62019.1 Bacterial PH domain-containing protein [Bifidobacterium lemurum]
MRNPQSQPQTQPPVQPQSQSLAQPQSQPSSQRPLQRSTRPQEWPTAWDSPETNGAGTEGSTGEQSRQWRALPPRVKRVWLLNQAIATVVVLACCAAAVAVCLINDWWGFWPGLIIGVVAAVDIVSLAVQPLQTAYQYAFNRFAIGERELVLKKGWLLRSTTTVPFNRVQHVDTKQGPVLRAFDLMAVIVHTAVGEHTIEALDVDEAQRVVELITARVLAAKEDL